MIGDSTTRSLCKSHQFTMDFNRWICTVHIDFDITAHINLGIVYAHIKAQGDASLISREPRKLEQMKLLSLQYANHVQLLHLLFRFVGS